MPLQQSLARFHRFDRAERGTIMLGAATTILATIVVGREIGPFLRARRRQGRLAAPEQLSHVAEEKTRQAVENYRNLSDRDVALFHLYTSFFISATLARAIAAGLRRRNSVGPFRSVRLGESHIHHFIPGLLLALGSGAAALVTDSPSTRANLAIPFGVGLGMTLDESALLLKLDDVYWSREGLLGIQITLTTLAGLNALHISRRLLKDEADGNRQEDPNHNET